MDKNVKIGVGAVVLITASVLILGGEKADKTLDLENSEIEVAKEISIADWPEVIPVYREGAEVKKIDSSFDEDGNEKWRIALLVSEDKDTIYNWYKETLRVEGWDVSSKVIQMYEIIEANKGNLYTTFQVHYDSDQEKSSISQSASIKVLEEGGEGLEVKKVLTDEEKINEGETRAEEVELEKEEI